MPQSIIFEPAHWRERAAEARELADRMTDEIAKQKMLGIAFEYEQLAKRAEERIANRRATAE